MKTRWIYILLLGGMCIVSGCAKQRVVANDGPFAPSKSVATHNKPELLRTEQSKTEQSNAESGKSAALHSASIKPSSSRTDQSNTDLISGNGSLEPIQNAGELKAELNVIYFEFDSYSLSQKARNSLVKIAETMKKDPHITVRIEGNCDERGSDEYNLALGEKRAQSAMQYLVTMGTPENRLSEISYGKEKPVALGHNEDSWAKNRRDEFVVTMK